MTGTLKSRRRRSIQSSSYSTYHWGVRGVFAACSLSVAPDAGEVPGRRRARGPVPRTEGRRRRRPPPAAAGRRLNRELEGASAQVGGAAACFSLADEFSIAVRPIAV